MYIVDVRNKSLSKFIGTIYDCPSIIKTGSDSSSSSSSSSTYQPNDLLWNTKITKAEVDQYLIEYIRDTYGVILTKHNNNLKIRAISKMGGELWLMNHMKYFTNIRTLKKYMGINIYESENLVDSRKWYLDTTLGIILFLKRNAKQFLHNIDIQYIQYPTPLISNLLECYQRFVFDKNKMSLEDIIEFSSFLVEVNACIIANSSEVESNLELWKTCFKSTITLRQLVNNQT